jgi:cytochrome oxidase Cu insertion factor (SCO1/SenC/PrrC family)
MIRFILLLITGALLVSSCRSTRKIQTAISTKKDSVEVLQKTSDPHEDSVRFIKENYSQLLANRIEFETFSAKINTDYQGGDGKNMT